jgi:Tat protein secretion system quality control protein TatD with DNase activity
LASVPLNKFFLETDSGERTIEEIYQLAATAIQITEDSLSLQLEKNFKSVFSASIDSIS